MLNPLLVVLPKADKHGHVRNSVEGSCKFAPFSPVPMPTESMPQALIASTPACASSMPMHCCGSTPSPAQAARNISGSGFEWVISAASAQKSKQALRSSACKIVGALSDTEANPTGIRSSRNVINSSRIPCNTESTVNWRKEWTYSRFFLSANCAQVSGVNSPPSRRGAKYAAVIRCD